MFGLRISGATVYHTARLLFWTVVGIALWFIPRRFRPRKNIQNEVVLLTGAGSGLGRQLALRLSAQGAKLVLWDINKRLNEETERIVRQSGGQAKSYVVDITNRQAVYETAAKVTADVGPVSILINNAGIYLVKYLMDLDDKGITKTMQTNALSNFWTVKAFLPDMVARNKGHIVSIASVSGLIGVPTQTDYCSSKHAAIGFMEALSSELAFRGLRAIKTTLVCPAFFASGLYKNLGNGLLPEMSTERVADEAVDGILREEPRVIIPGGYKILVVLYNVLPPQAKGILGDIMGMGHMLKNIQSNRHVVMDRNGVM